ncbi:MAG: LysM peptidoglycan-binding domain-containing protein [Anaerolineae bacterium]|nr:LysM peptidoglycan-binding domain-containing protein [Anaerolineae bacterium]
MSRLRRLAPLVLLVCLFVITAPAFAQEQTHVVQPGENLFRIALRYGLDVPTLAQANNISNTWQIYVGQTLIIPTPGAAPAPAEPAPAPVEQPPVVVTTEYVVQRGDTLRSIAQAFGMTVDQLATLNNLTNPNLIYYGQRLNVTSSAPAEPVPAPVEVVAAPVEPAPVAAAPAEPLIHIVQRGEYLSSIARQYGVNWTDIAAANNIYDPNTVFAGTRLIIPAPGVAVGSAPAVAVPAAPPAYIGSGREVIVDLSDSRVYAYENGVLVRNVLASMGMAFTPTVQGDFTIQRKYFAQTMTGPGYYLPDVPYVMYFYAGYALHGTYWHSNWGQPMSHGCVNLPTLEAQWFFDFTEVGTPVHVQA